MRQTIIEMDALLLFVTAAGDGTCLAVLAEAEADAGLVAYEMAVLVKRVGQHLQASPRYEAVSGEFGGAGGPRHGDSERWTRRQSSGWTGMPVRSCARTR